MVAPDAGMFTELLAKAGIERRTAHKTIATRPGAGHAGLPPSTAASTGERASHPAFGGLELSEPGPQPVGASEVSSQAATFVRLPDAVGVLASYDGGDTGFLNACFPHWYTLSAQHRLPFAYNAQRTLHWLTYEKQPGYWQAIQPIKVTIASTRCASRCNGWFVLAIAVGKPSRSHCWKLQPPEWALPTCRSCISAAPRSRGKLLLDPARGPWRCFGGKHTCGHSLGKCEGALSWQLGDRCCVAAPCEHGTLGWPGHSTGVNKNYSTSL